MNPDMFTPTQTIGSVLCCMCGVCMQPNAANMCLRCLRSRVDITEGLQKSLAIIHCPECNTYLQPPRTWIKADLESKELLTFCIKRLKNMNLVRLVHAEFVWTEPHSKRIKVRLKIQKEALHGVILEQTYIVEYTQQEHMCDSCTRIQANPDQWIANVQLRQHVSHRRTFFHLEQLILKHGASLKAINIKEMHQGIDFFFGNRSHAVKFVEFLGNVVPIKKREDKQLVSQDKKSNSYNYKYTLSIVICPICRQDLICLPPKVSVNLGNLGPIVLCTKVTNNILLLDPHSLRSVFVDANQYWRAPFNTLLHSRQLVEYIVHDVFEHDYKSEVKVGSTKYLSAFVEISRVSDLGKNDMMFTVRTHLGHLLNPGDHALGYDLHGANSNDVEVGKYKNLSFPDVILVKKCYEETLQKGKMDVMKNHKDGARKDDEYDKFLDDLEANPEMRFNLSLHDGSKEYQPSDDDDDRSMSEMIADLDLNDYDDDEEEEEAVVDHDGRCISNKMEE
ncbi:Nonsense-mediated mRNA decay NMD3 family protein [Zostera marina]|uniref:60S ribosomal export protein NMD3 n=1 Tax=Zostera marina TaxID=29655 RepID=A0A0K9NSI3_ZOSMR|nr:Nonsense-mediated mRNA decay NMD3 family protein [Zostera marina]